MSALKRFLIDVLTDAVRDRQRRDMILSLVLERYELAPDGRTKRLPVYRHVASRLNRRLNNSLCNEVRDALLASGVEVVTLHGGHSRFSGIRERVTT